MPEELMIEHCSPTMAGLKTANLFGIYILNITINLAYFNIVL